VMALGPAGTVVGVPGVAVVGLPLEQPELLKVLQVTSGLGIRLEFLRNTVPPLVPEQLLVDGAKVSWWIGERSMLGVRGDGGREEQHEDCEVGEPRRGE
jgi:hypothetical protein